MSCDTCVNFAACKKICALLVEQEPPQVWGDDREYKAYPKTPQEVRLYCLKNLPYCGHVQGLQDPAQIKAAPKGLQSCLFSPSQYVPVGGPSRS
jgi:hypothetical protein